MIRGFYSASLGLNNSQTKLDTIANNVANVNTTGFKSQAASFSDTLYSNLQENVNIGSGSRVAGNSIRFQNGAMQQTGEALDFAIDGDGFFAVIDRNGNVFYTRSGAFSVSVEGDNNYLVTSEGFYVLGQDMNFIAVTDGEPAAMPGVFDFPNVYGLQLLGGSRFAETPLSGQAQPVEDARVMQGYLEGSAVDLVEEMSKMIEAQRVFQMNSKIIQVADEMEQTANTLRR
ncbi:MAG TPA: flagellar hook-basal body protein [Clostridiales bacterium]|nr:flagellar hook-basal body protein [Clostridiales bacterium]